MALGFGLAPEVKAQQVATARVVAAKGAWSAATNYVTDDLVTSRGSTWRAKRANTNKIPGQTTPSTTAADWELFAAGFNPTGEWQGSTTYHVNDLVMRQGTTWRATRTNISKMPQAGANWELLASKGKEGDAGTTGAQGATGPAGATGATGATGAAGAGSTTGVANGTLAAPSFSFASEPGTGMFLSSPFRIALAAGGGYFMHTEGGVSSLSLGFGSLPVGSGNFNTAIGTSTLANNFASFNTAVGSGAMSGNTTGQTNTALGSGALSGNTTTSSNTAIGASTLTNINTGGNNTAVGARALRVTSAGADNVAVGQNALTANVDGGFNVAVGSKSLAANTLGAGNVVLGYEAKATNTEGDYNIAIGYQAGKSATNATSNNIFIGHDGSGTATSGTIKIGTAATHSTAFISGITGVTTNVDDAVPVMIDSAGQLGVTSSSLRYKFDINGMGDVNAMLAKLRPVTFRYNQAQNGGVHPLQYGLIAEEVAEVFPDLAVFNKDDAPETVKYHLLPNFLLAGYQSQQKVIDAQAAKIEAQAENIAAMEARLAALEARMGRLATR